ncbi:MAG: M28 family peptidase [Candidatus Lokiarchaeota archaeon]|nr:M28 family peptidase [Candidatus Lokiarchaeota archaeon]MBD3338847.1 M28 family peptidase [Candidatus Lokiarchaeota archaeon]
MNLDDIEGQKIFDHMKTLCNFGYRWAGTKPALQAEDYIFNELKKVGVSDVQMEEYTFRRWWAEEYNLKILRESVPALTEDLVIDSFPVWLSGSTEKEGITAEIIYAGNGTSVDFERISVEKKIVLVEGKMILNFHPSYTDRGFDSLNLAKENGALGAIFINNSPLDYITYIFFMSMFGWKRRLPALSINNIDGNYLKKLSLSHDFTPKVRLVQWVKTEKAPSKFIVGTLPGQSDDILLVGTHTDSTFTGAMDNAAANAGLIEIARYFAGIPEKKREKTLKFVGWTGHEAGLIGVNVFTKTHQDMLNNICTFIMLDGLASNGYYNQADGGVIATGRDEKRGLFITDNAILTPIVMDATLKYDLLPAAYVSAKTLPVSDLGPFVFSNVPCIMVIGKSIFYHTKGDTIDKVPPDRLERATKAHIEIIEKIMEVPKDKIIEADGKLENLKQFIEKKEGVEPPSGFFDILPHPIPIGYSAIFHPTVFTCPESIAIDFEWDFGDGNTSNTILTKHEYDIPGKYDVKFTVTDNFGNVGIINREVRVIKN